MGPIKSRLNIYFLNVHHTILKHNFYDYLKQVLLPDVFQAFIHHRVFDKIVFCLGEKQGMIVNDNFSLCMV